MAGQHAKKRKREQPSSAPNNAVDTSKPTAIFKPTTGRSHTLSIALPGSIIANAQSHELKTTLCGQIARALAVFCVDEVIVYDDGQSKTHQTGNRSGYDHQQYQYGGQGGPAADDQTYTGQSDPDHFLIHLLSYLETPPHLRKHLFPLHPNLRSAGTLPSLDMPHHLKQDEWCQYREGVTIPDPDVPHSQGRGKKPGKQWQPPVQSLANSSSSIVQAGLPQRTEIPIALPPHTRVTLRFPSTTAPPAHSVEPLLAQPVAPSAPRTEAGYYWGYSIRQASSLSAVFTESPFDGGYDVTIGTSERGVPIDEAIAPLVAPGSDFHYSHLMLVFGGVAGLEIAVKADSELATLDVMEPKGLFDHWVDLCPGQGSRTIRTEEAVWIGLMALRRLVLANA